VSPETPSSTAPLRVELESVLPRAPSDGDDMELELGESLADAVFRQLTQTVGARASSESDGLRRGGAIRGATPPFGTPSSFVGRDESAIEPLEILPLAARIFDSVPAPPPVALLSVPPPPMSDSIPPSPDLGELVEPDALAAPPSTPPRASEPAPLDAPRDPVTGAVSVVPPSMAVAASEPPPPPRSIPAGPTSPAEVSPAAVDVLTRTADAAPEPAAPEPAATEPAAPEPAATEPAVDAPVEVPSSARSSIRPAYTRPLQAPPTEGEPDGAGRTLRLVLLVLFAGALSYLAVRVLLGRRAVVEPERIEQPTPQTPPPLPAPQGVEPDAGAARRADAGAGYVEPAAFLDGGTLPEGAGLLVVPRPRAGTPRVTVVVEHVGSYTAPAAIPLPEDVYRLRFESGRIRSVQFATVRRGWAVVRPAPSER
jgi:hypothetical protein